MPPQKNHGGSRKGAGRPKIGNERRVVLSDADWAKAKALGNGNASAGIRQLLEEREMNEPTLQQIKDEISGHMNANAHAIWAGMLRSDKDQYAIAVQRGETTVEEIAAKYNACADAEAAE